MSPQKTPSALQLALASVQQKVKARPKPQIQPSPEQVAAEEARKMREKQEAIRKARVIKLQQDAAHEAIKEAFSKDPTKAGDGPGFYIHQSYHPQFGKYYQKVYRPHLVVPWH